MANLMELLESAGGAGSLQAMTKQLGLDSSDTSKLVGALAPALMRGLQKQTESPDSLAGLTKALKGGDHQKYLDNPDLVQASDTRQDGNNILGHIFGSKDVSRNVAAQAAESSGISSGLLKKALPIIAGLAMGALSKKEKASPQGFDAGMLETDDGFGFDDVLNIAKKFL